MLIWVCCPQVPCPICINDRPKGWSSLQSCQLGNDASKTNLKHVKIRPGSFSSRHQTAPIFTSIFLFLLAFLLYGSVCIHDSVPVVFPLFVHCNGIIAHEADVDMYPISYCIFYKCTKIHCIGCSFYTNRKYFFHKERLPRLWRGTFNKCKFRIYFIHCVGDAVQISYRKHYNYYWFLSVISCILLGGFPFLTFFLTIRRKANQQCLSQGRMIVFLKKELRLSESIFRWVKSYTGPDPLPWNPL